MKVLMVSEVLTHPAQMGNQQRIYRECTQMRQLGWEVDYLYLGNELGNRLELTRKFFGEDHFYQCYKGIGTIKAEIKKDIRKWLDKKRISRYVALMYETDEWYISELKDRVMDLQKRNHYDAVWLQYLYQSKFMESIFDEGVTKIIDTHDKWANRNRIYQKLGKVPELFYTTTKGERRALSRADVVIAIQDREKAYFERLLRKTSTKVITIGDMVEKRKAEDGEEFTYGLIGAANRPNIMSIEWFCKKILPIVRTKCPQARFVVAGGVCDKIPECEGMYKIGRVNEVDDFYNMVKVVINPMQTGTGLNIKTIEALAYGKPLIVTSVGAKGIVSEEVVLKECNEPDEFADAIIELLRDDLMRRKFRENAHVYIEEYNKKNVLELTRVKSDTCS